jgi:sugar lactone lactonase YvrE
MGMRVHSFIICVLFCAARVTRADTLYVSNSQGQTIEKFTAAHAGSVFGSMSNPEGLAFDSAGNLYAADNTNNQIVKFASAGVGSLFANDHLFGPAALSIDSSGNLFAANNGGYYSIGKFTPGGTGSFFAEPPSGLSAPFGTAFDTAGNLFVSNTNTQDILKFTSAGTGSFFAHDEGTPRGLAFDSAGNLYVANSGNSRIMKFDSLGAGTKFADTGSGPIGLAFDSAGKLYVTLANENKIEQYSSAGADLGVFADSSDGLASPYFLAFGPNAVTAAPLPPAVLGGMALLSTVWVIDRKRRLAIG